MEVIFVDDGSEDQTLPMINAFVSKMDIKCKVFHDKWRGLGPARNTVVKNASGDYIVWVDGDMTIPPDYIKQQAEFMRRHPKAAIAQGNIAMSPDTSLVATLENSYYFTVGFKNFGAPTDRPLGTCGSIFRVNAIRQVGGFDEKIRGAGEDVELAHRVRASGWLLYINQHEFLDRFRDTWKALWRSYYWYGYGLHQVKHKHKDALIVYKFLPPIAAIGGLRDSITAYRITHRKVVFLLPVEFAFKMTAWCFGFVKSHLKAHGHNFKSH